MSGSCDPLLTPAHSKWVPMRKVEAQSPFSRRNTAFYQGGRIGVIRVVPPPNTNLYLPQCCMWAHPLSSSGPSFICVRACEKMLGSSGADGLPINLSITAVEQQMCNGLLEYIIIGNHCKVMMGNHKSYQKFAFILTQIWLNEVCRTKWTKVYF